LVSIHFFLAHALTAEIYSLSLHDALPIYVDIPVEVGVDRGLIVAERPVGGEPDAAADLPASADDRRQDRGGLALAARRDRARQRSEEHTSELQSRFDLVCRLLLDKKNNI